MEGDYFIFNVVWDIELSASVNILWHFYTLYNILVEFKRLLSSLPQLPSAVSCRQQKLHRNWILRFFNWGCLTHVKLYNGKIVIYLFMYLIIEVNVYVLHLYCGLVWHRIERNWSEWASAARRFRHREFWGKSRVAWLFDFIYFVFSARCNIYISRLCYDVSVCLSVTEVHWRIIANLGFKFRSKFTAHCGRGEG